MHSIYIYIIHIYLYSLFLFAYVNNPHETHILTTKLRCGSPKISELYIIIIAKSCIACTNPYMCVCKYICVYLCCKCKSIHIHTWGAGLPCQVPSVHDFVVLRSGARKIKRHKIRWRVFFAIYARLPYILVYAVHVSKHNKVEVLRVRKYKVRSLCLCVRVWKRYALYLYIFVYDVLIFITGTADAKNGIEVPRTHPICIRKIFLMT